MQNKLREVREKKGISIMELSKKAGVSRQTIYNIELNPDYVATVPVMESLAKALDMKASKIFLL